MAKVSIIVPIYNVEKYVRKCLDSLLNQTYKDFVVYAVNDGSPANEQPILEEYAKKDERILAILKENGGYGSVLQQTIEKIETPYFLICDPDDYLDETALEKLVEQAERLKSDITIGSKYFVYSDNAQEEYDASYNKSFVTLKENEVYSNGDVVYNDLFFIDPSPHSKLYKTELAKDLIFPSKVGYTDNLLFYHCLLRAKKVSYTSFACAYYLVDRVGNTMTDIKPKVIDDHVLVFTQIINDSKCVTSVSDMFYYRMFESFKFIFYYIRRIDGATSLKEEKAWNVYKLFELLKQNKSAILSMYLKYAKTSSIEALKDRALFTPFSKSVYKDMIGKL